METLAPGYLSCFPTRTEVHARMATKWQKRAAQAYDMAQNDLADGDVRGYNWWMGTAHADSDTAMQFLGLKEEDQLYA